MFFNSLGGAFAISIAQNIFSNTLSQEIVRLAPTVNPATIIAAGATHISEVTPPGQLSALLEAYNIAVTRTYTSSIAAGCLAFVCSLFMEWKTVKGAKFSMGGV